MEFFFQISDTFFKKKEKRTTKYYWKLERCFVQLEQNARSEDTQHTTP